MHCHSKKFATFDIRLRYFRSTIQKKRVSFWYCPRLIVPLTFVEDTFVRQFKNKRVSFWYCPHLIVSLQLKTYTRCEKRFIISSCSLRLACCLPPAADAPPMPEVYAQIGALGQSIVVGDSLIGISLDKYLGTDYPLYGNFYDQRQRYTMTRASIVPDCLVFWLLSHYPLDNFETASQHARDIHMGRVMWVANQAMGKPFFKTEHTALANQLMVKTPHMTADELLKADIPEPIPSSSPTAIQ